MPCPRRGCCPTIPWSSAWKSWRNWERTKWADFPSWVQAQTLWWPEIQSPPSWRSRPLTCAPSLGLLLDDHHWKIHLQSQLQRSYEQYLVNLTIIDYLVLKLLIFLGSPGPDFGLTATVQNIFRTKTLGLFFSFFLCHIRFSPKVLS